MKLDQNSCAAFPVTRIVACAEAGEALYVSASKVFALPDIDLTPLHEEEALPGSKQDVDTRLMESRVCTDDCELVTTIIRTPSKGRFVVFDQRRDRCEVVFPGGSRRAAGQILRWLYDAGWKDCLDVS